MTLFNNIYFYMIDEFQNIIFYRLYRNACASDLGGHYTYKKIAFS